MTTRVRKYTREEIIQMGPEKVEEAARANDPAPASLMDMDPRNMKEVIRKTDPYTGLGYQQASNVRVMVEAGVTPVWNMQTGHPTMVLINLLQTKLSETNEQGQIVFTTHPELVPEGLPHIPEYPCMLNEKNEIWSPLATRLGFRSCRKMLRTRHDVIKHAKVRHRNAWDSFERDKEENLRAEEHEVRVEQLAAYKQTNAGIPDGGLNVEKACVGCGISLFASTEEAVMVKLGVHARDCEPFHKMFPNIPSSVPDVSQTLEDSDTTTTGTLTIMKDPKPMVRKPCPHCEFVSESTLLAGAASRLRGHIRKDHPDAD